MKLVVLFGLLVSASLINVTNSESEDKFEAFLERIVSSKILKNSINIVKKLQLPENKEKREKVEEMIKDILGSKALEYITKFAKYGGPVAEALSLGLALFAESENAKFERIDARFDKVDQRLEEIVNQVCKDLSYHEQSCN